MPRTELIQTRVEPGIKDQAAEVLDRWGLSVSDVVRIVLTRTAREGHPPIEMLSSSEEHDAWFREAVSQGLEDQQSADVEQVKANLARQRADLRSKVR